MFWVIMVIVLGGFVWAMGYHIYKMELNQDEPITDEVPEDAIPAIDGIPGYASKIEEDDDYPSFL